MLDINPKHYKIILWDIDGTLLDFHPAEKHALTTTAAAFGWPKITPELLARYSKINADHWLRMERGEISKQEVLEGRFGVFCNQEGIEFSDYAAFNEAYQRNLGAQVFFHDQAYEIVEALKGKMKQYGVTNGNRIAQHLKMKNSGFDKLLDACFISDEVGYEKPALEYFNHVLSQIEQVSKEEIIIVGDSLTSDMLGGYRAGLKCCWFNPEGKPVPELPHIDYDIRKLIELKDIL